MNLTFSAGPVKHTGLVKHLKVNLIAFIKIFLGLPLSLKIFVTSKQLCV